MITIQYGQWSPDTANVSFQMPDQEGPVTVPVADCLNVYFQDGAYRNLPAPASIGPALGFQCLNAVTWYDQVAQQEIIFAAGANSISELIDGAWSSVPISAGQQLFNGTLTPATSGSNVGYSTASSYGTLTPLADTNNNAIGAINQLTGASPAFTVTINAANLGQSYFATIYFPSLGLSLPTSSATYSHSSSTTLLNATLTAGSTTNDVGYLSGSFGSLSPAVDSNGHTITALYQLTPPLSGSTITLTIGTAALGATYLTTVQVPALGVTLVASAATYSSSGGSSTWTWNSGAFNAMNGGTAYNVLLTFAPSPATSTWTWSGTSVPLVSGTAYNVVLTAPSTISENATFWSFAAQGPYLAAVPYTKTSQATGPYVWINQGSGNSNFVRPQGAPGCRVGATVGQFLMVGDLLQAQTQTLFTGNGSQASYAGTLSTPMLGSGTVSDQQNALFGSFNNGSINPSGLLSQGTIDYANGAINLVFSSAVPNGDQVYANYTQVAPYRVAWSAIGNPTSWPTPLTNAAIAAQSGYNDLEVDLGPVMFISGYPLYGVIFQKKGITRANYIGGNVVFSWQTYERKRGLVAHGAAIQVGVNTYFLSDAGWFYTDGANVVPIGTAEDNSAGIDNWFWSNVNVSALDSIRAGYDGIKRCVMFAIPTGANVLPDTLIIYNILSGRWTRASVFAESLWTADNGTDGVQGTRQALGVFDQTHTPNMLTGAALTGYLESADLSFSDGLKRFTPSVRPNIACTDTPNVIVGVRNNLESPVIRSQPGIPDVFGAGFAPTLNQKGLYTRVMLVSSAASAVNGATMKMRPGGPL